MYVCMYAPVTVAFSNFSDVVWTGPQKRVRRAHGQTEMNSEQPNGGGVLEKMHQRSSLRFLMRSLLDVVIPFSFCGPYCVLTTFGFLCSVYVFLIEFSWRYQLSSIFCPVSAFLFAVRFFSLLHFSFTLRISVHPSVTLLKFLCVLLWVLFMVGSNRVTILLSTLHSDFAFPFTFCHFPLTSFTFFPYPSPQPFALLLTFPFFLCFHFAFCFTLW